MKNENNITAEEINIMYQILLKYAEESGYYLNPNTSFAKELVKGLIVNNKRYGYFSCPCRLASGDKEEDADIICPCDYRDMDIDEYDACYCALYVSEAAHKGKKKASSIPDRRLPLDERKKAVAEIKINRFGLSVPVWRCRVCGYLCGREAAPEVCPVCKAKKERFERFM